MKNSLALITGGSEGIGYELAKLFAQDGYSLFLISRDKSKLEKAQETLHSRYGTDVKILPFDLTDLKALPDIFQELKDQDIKADVLVNDAGFGLLGNFNELDIRKQLNMIDLNIGALTYMTKLFLEQAPENAKILNLSSLAAFQPGPFMNVYYATKAYVLSFSVALAEELKDKNITVTALCPGPVATDFWKVSRPDRESIAWTTKLIELSPEFVARAGYRGFLKGRRIIIPGIINRLLRFADRLLPSATVAGIVNRMNKKL